MHLSKLDVVALFIALVALGGLTSRLYHIIRIWKRV